MKNNKKIMLSLAMVAVIAVAAIGIGYAYQASTQNSDNQVDSEYLTIVPTTDGSTGEIYSNSFDKKIAYDTEKIEGNVKYSLAEELRTTVDGRQAIEIGTLYLTIDHQNATTPAAYDLNIKATVEGVGSGLDVTNFLYKVAIKTGTGANVGAAKSAAEGAGASYYNYVPASGVTIPSVEKTGDYRVALVTLYVCIKDADEKTVEDESAATPAALPTEPLHEVTFSFKAVAINHAATRTVTITAGNNSGIDSGSGALTQSISVGAVKEIVVKAGDGYTFAGVDPLIVSGATNGLTVTLGTDGKIHIVGNPTADVTITLAAAVTSL
ncbi:MAG: hypothetical protein J5673_05090 [Candidatus Methanomethylophilaceae archaeon]|nr:hypothetical protein [Candidatus Methanomethylophilaceae archaeon]